MSENYWRNRVSRRAALRTAGLGAVGIVGAALLGCGESEDGGTPAGGTATGTTPSGTSAPSGDVQTGGTFRVFRNVDNDTFDPYNYVAGGTVDILSFAYGRLARFVPGDGVAATGETEPDLAETIETPDPQTIIFKLRQDAKWDERAPTNGRLMDAEDVVGNFERYRAESARRTLMFNDASPDAPISSVQALDDYTVELKLAFPDATMLQLLAYPNTAVFISPREGSNGGFDTKRDMRGNGPWLLDSYDPSVSYRFTKNPNWHGSPNPHFDAIEMAIIGDTAQVEAQFRAGNLHQGTPLGVPMANIPNVVREVEDAEAYPLPPNFKGEIWGLNRIPDSAWNDERVRRAVSMLIDRDTFVDTVLEPGAFTDIGLELNTYWNGPLPAGYGKYWLDPKGSDFGEAAMYLEHNIEEARKLLDAAGYNDGNPLEFDIIFPGVQYGPHIPTAAEILQSMISEGPVRPHLWVMDYTTEWIPDPAEGGIYRAHSTFEGRDGRKTAITYRPGSGKDSASGWLTFNFHPTSASAAPGDGEFPELEEMLMQARFTESEDEHVAAVQDIQRYIVDQMVAIPVGMTTDVVGLKRKGLHGPQQVLSWGGEDAGSVVAEAWPHYWIDDSLRS